MNLKDADTDGDVNWFRPVFSFWLRSCERVRIQIQKIVEVFALGFVSVVMNKSVSVSGFGSGYYNCKT